MAGLSLGWMPLIALLGAIQGVLLAGALATKRRNRAANRILAGTMFAFSLHLATEVYHAAGLELRFPHFFGVGYPLPFLYGPLIYLYALSAADRSRRLTWRDALHLTPFCVVVIAGLPIFFMSGAEKVAFHQRLVAGAAPLLIRVADPLKFVSGVAYAVLTMQFLRRHREQVKASYSTTDSVNLRWLLWLGGAAAAVWALAVGLELLDVAGMVHLRDDAPVSLAIALLVYGVGYRGLRQPEVFRFESAEYPIVRLPPPAQQPSEPVASAPPRYERSGLSEQDATQLAAAVVALMEGERPWRDCELTLANLADRLSTTPHRLSEVLNAQIGQSFYDFVNGYRVREVQQRIAAGDARRVTMLALALDAGFASKSTFNLVFKKHTGQTPSRFRQAAGPPSAGA